MERSKRRTKDAVELMDQWYGGDPGWNQMVIEEEIKARVGQIIYYLRTEANLSQTRLAEMIGVTQAMVSKLENADYNGDFFGLLLRVCFVLHKKLSVGGPGIPLTNDDEYCALVMPA